ncbi:MAG: hypothetical protein QOE71_3321 [Pseudonocardiales bacterium]|jgi:hypothetical protein|nr:hypothetical protein [Pseudonocardiales bacterium]
MRRAFLVGPLVVGAVSALALSGVAAAKTPAASYAASFAVGQPQATTVGASGCGTNVAGEPSIHVSKSNLVGLGSENGLGGGSEYWRKTQVGGAGASACALTYSGQPNAVGGTGASGGDIDTAFAPVKDPATGTYRIYVASLNLASINVATSTDNGATFTQVPVQAGIPADDREWIAAYGAKTSLLTYHDIASNNIDVLRSDTGGAPYTQISQAIPATDYKAANNELGNIVIDHNATSPVAGGFYAYQSFVAPSTDPGASGAVNGAPYNEAFLAVSADGGHTFTDRPIGCSTASGGTLNHQFPNVSVAPNGTLVETWSNDTNVFAAYSRDHGTSWTCTGAVSTNTRQAIEPWVVAGATGVDLVYYGTTDAPGPNQAWYVYFTQLSSTGVSSPQRITAVHLGPVCEGGVGCTGGRQLLDDFGVDTDQAGYAHIAFSHDAPTLGGTGSYTGYAVQTTGHTIGAPN